MVEHAAQHIFADLADITRGAAHQRQPDHGVGGGATRNLNADTHGAIQRIGLLGVDQRHRALVQRVLDEKRIFGMGDHIDDRIADADHVQTCLRHIFSPIHPRFGRCAQHYRRLDAEYILGLAAPTATP